LSEHNDMQTGSHTRPSALSGPLSEDIEW